MKVSGQGLRNRFFYTCLATFAILSLPLREGWKLSFSENWEGGLLRSTASNDEELMDRYLVHKTGFCPYFSEKEWLLRASRKAAIQYYRP